MLRNLASSSCRSALNLFSMCFYFKKHILVTVFLLACFVLLATFVFNACFSEFLNGHFFSKIYRAKLNRTSCSRYRGVKSSCGEWVPSSDRCKKVCFDVRHWRYKSIMPCGQRRSNYLKVYSVEANLTAGHNLIVIPKGQWFTAGLFSAPIGGWHFKFLRVLT